MFLLALVACFGPTASSYPEQIGEAYCSYIEECDGTYFKDAFSDLDDCVDEFLDDVDEDDLEDCDFDKDKAKSCLDAMNDAKEDCDEDDLYDDDCAEVYDCDGAGDDDDDDDDAPVLLTEDVFVDRFFEKACDAGCDDAEFFCGALDATDTTGGTGTCDFDPDVARACLNAEWTCEDNGAGGTYTSIASVCSEICG